MGGRRTLVVGIVLALPLGVAAQAVTRAVPPSALAQGRWAILAVVLPGCPACVEALRWFGEAFRPEAEPRLLLLAPWGSEELDSAASRYGLPALVDEGGVLGASLGVRRAPTLVLLLDGRIFHRLAWPFTRDALLQAVGELEAAPREGPWGLLGKDVSLGRAQGLDVRDPDLGEVFQPLLLLFFNPRCPPCGEALPGLLGLRDELAIVVVLVGAELLTEGERNRLEGTGLPVVRDAGELGRAFAVRATPTYVILDRKGVIRWVHEGLVERDVLREAILALTGEAGTEE